MYQKFTAVGFLGMNPVAKETASGQKLATFTVATSRRFKDKDGNRVTDTQWIPCVTFGKLAELANQYLNKGKKVLIEGRLQTRSYEKQVPTGHENETVPVKMFHTEVILSNFIMLDARPKEIEAPSGDELPEPDQLFEDDAA